jgi:hypothetical protein
MALERRISPTKTAETYLSLYRIPEKIQKEREQVARNTQDARKETTSTRFAVKEAEPGLRSAQEATAGDQRYNIAGRG